jgi:hypothetical protein
MLFHTSLGKLGPRLQVARLIALRERFIPYFVQGPTVTCAAPQSHPSNSRLVLVSVALFQEISHADLPSHLMQFQQIVWPPYIKSTPSERIIFRTVRTLAFASALIKFWYNFSRAPTKSPPFPEFSAAPTAAKMPLYDCG